MFSTGQYGRFYVVSNWDSDPAFRIQILPEGEVAKPNGKPNLCLNSDAVLVYGHVPDPSKKSGKSCGWIHQGKWVDDFLALANSIFEEKREKEERLAREKEERETAKMKRELELLSQYQ